ncbi:Small GTPase Rab7 [Entamoeba marina]
MTSRTFKVVFVGDAGVGKTSLIKHYINHSYSTDYRSTIGTDVHQKDVVVDDVPYSLTIWDTAGHEKYQSLIKSFYRGTDFCVFVFDITSQESFKDIENWYNEFMNEVGNDNEQSTCIIVGNKLDLGISREVPIEQAQQYAKQKGWMYIETSAAVGENVDEMMIELIHCRNPKITPEKYPHIPTFVNLKQRNNGSCC